MDANRFDALLQTLATAPTRRGALRLLAASALGALALGKTESEAKKKKKRKKVTLCHNGQTIQVKKKKRKKHLRHGDTAGPCTGPTCSDGVKNGDETGVDCGGSCPRCGQGSSCTDRNDCETAYCVSNTCQSCVNAGDCGVQADGVTMCACRDSLRVPGQRLCTNQDGRYIEGGSCTDCLPSEVCAEAGLAGIYCILPCGAA